MILCSLLHNHIVRLKRCSRTYDSYFLQGVVLIFINMDFAPQWMHDVIQEAETAQLATRPLRWTGTRWIEPGVYYLQNGSSLTRNKPSSGQYESILVQSGGWYGHVYPEIWQAVADDIRFHSCQEGVEFLRGDLHPNPVILWPKPDSQ